MPAPVNVDCVWLKGWFIMDLADSVCVSAPVYHTTAVCLMIGVLKIS